MTNIQDLKKEVASLEEQIHALEVLQASLFVLLTRIKAQIDDIDNGLSGLKGVA